MQRGCTALVSIRVIHFVPAEAGECEDRDCDTRVVMSPELSDEGPCERTVRWSMRERGRDGGREEEVLMSEGLCCGNSADLPSLAVDDWLALWPGCMENDCL